jgi:hypothetical protein
MIAFFKAHKHGINNPFSICETRPGLTQEPMIMLSRGNYATGHVHISHAETQANAQRTKLASSSNFRSHPANFKRYSGSSWQLQTERCITEGLTVLCAHA